MKRLLILLCFILTLILWAAASAEIAVSVSPEKPRKGDYVDVTVTPDRENAEDVTYTLLCDGEKVFAGKAVKHFTASFRPRQEGTYTLQVTVSYGKKDKETAEITVPVAGEAPAQESPDVVYSQKDGWWHKVMYAPKYSRSLEKSGCAIFTLSHILQRMGYTGEDVTPGALAKANSYFYREGEGTNNSGLINKASQDYDFITQDDLIKSEKEIAAGLRRGDLYSFSIVIGHIAMADGISEDGTKVHIVDSAPGATYERVKATGVIFFQNEDGSFTEANTPEDLPGIRWFFETKEYGGMAYWMDISYCASRGFRMIRVPWLKADLGEGPQGVSIEYTGAMITKVNRDGESFRIPTRDLLMTGAAPGSQQVALVTAKNGTTLKDGNGKQISGKRKIPRQTMVLLLEAADDSLYAWWDNAFGYLTPEDVEVLPAVPESFPTGTIAINGNTTGALEMTVHLNPKAKSTGIATWKSGTPVAVVEKQDEFYLVEGKGLRGWVHEKYIQLDQENSGEEQENGQKIDEGK